MNRVERQNQQELNREILHFVRGMQSMAPVTAESVYNYLVNVARRKTDEMQVEDRLAYLTALEPPCLKKIVEWDGGEVVRYEITAAGMDLLDGNIPPPNWRPR